MFELIFTSVPKGLFLGKSGFSTAAMTAGMPANMVIPLENLSGYNFTYQGSELPPHLNPPCCYFIKMRYGTRQLSIIGRVAPNGLDHSKRNNKLAHHILLESPSELQCTGGAADLFLEPGSIDESSVMVQSGVFVENFLREPCELAARRLPVISTDAALPAATWQQLTGDSGTAAMIAHRFIKSPKQPVYIQYSPEIDSAALLQLIREVASLLDDDAKRNFTFSTYASNIDGNTECFLRFVPAFSPLLNNLKRFHRNELIDLGSTIDPGLLQQYENSDLMILARTGQKPEPVIEQHSNAVDTPVVATVMPAEVTLDLASMPPVDNDDDFSPLPPEVSQPINIRQSIRLSTVNQTPKQPLNIHIKENYTQQPRARISQREYVSNKRTYFIVAMISLLGLAAVLTVVFMMYLSPAEQPAENTDNAVTDPNQQQVSPVATVPATSNTPTAASAPQEETTSPVESVPAAPVDNPAPEASDSDSDLDSDSELPETEPAEQREIMQRTVSMADCEEILELEAVNSVSVLNLPPDDGLELFIANRAVTSHMVNKKNFTGHIQLPNALVNTVAICVDLEHIGSVRNESINDLIELQEALKLKIYSANFSSSGVFRQHSGGYLQLQYAPLENTLEVKFYKNKVSNTITPDLENIKYIYFKVIDPDGEKLYRWPLQIQQSYKMAISKKLAESLQLSDRLECTVADIPELNSYIRYTLPSFQLSFTLNEWNSDVGAYLKFKRDYDENFEKYQCSNDKPNLRGEELQKKALDLDLKKLDSFNEEVISYIRSFRSIHSDNHEDNHEKIQAEINQIIEILNKKISDQAVKSKFDDYTKSWKEELDLLKNFYDWSKKSAQTRSKLRDRLKGKINEVLMQAENISPEIKRFSAKYFNLDSPQYFNTETKKKLVERFKTELKKMLIEFIED